MKTKDDMRNAWGEIILGSVTGGGIYTAIGRIAESILVGFAVGILLLITKELYKNYIKRTYGKRKNK